MTNPIIEAASRFSAKTQATVDGILAEGTIFARRVRRDLIIADVSKNGDMDNCGIMYQLQEAGLAGRIPRD